jgi:arginine decarboxylase
VYFKSLDYPVIVIDGDYDSPRIGGILIRALVEELRSNDQRVLCGLNLDDARAGARTYVAASAVLISIDGSEEVDGEFQRLTAFLREQSARRANLPVFLYGERRTIEKVPSKLLKYIHGFIFLLKTPRASSRVRSCVRPKTTCRTCCRRSSRR